MTFAICLCSANDLGNPLILVWISAFILSSVNNEAVVPSDLIAFVKCFNASSSDNGGGS